MYVRNYGLQNTCLNKFLKNRISKDTSVSGMVKREEALLKSGRHHL